MRAVGVVDFGGPEALKVVELPEPTPGPGEVRVHSRAFTVNPTDTFVRNGARAEALRRDPPPYVAGMDLAGVIDAVGEGVTSLKMGDEVMAMVLPRGSHGAYAEKVVLSAQSVVPIPKGASMAAASTLPMNALTARLSLDQLALRPGQVLAVTGAAGCYGGYVVQLAKADGLTVVADASENDEALVGSLGADHVVRRGDDVSVRIRDRFPSGVDAVADGALLNTLALPAIRDGGALAAVRPFVGETERGITIHQTLVRDYDKRADLLDRLRAQVESGAVTLRVAQTFPPEQAGEAHRLLEKGGTRGRFVIEW